MKAVTVSSFRSKMKEYLDAISKSSELIVMPRNGNDDDAVVMMSIRDYNSWMETIHLMSSNSNRKRLEQGIQQAKEGKLRRYELDAPTRKKKK